MLELIKDVGVDDFANDIVRVTCAGEDSRESALGGRDVEQGCSPDFSNINIICNSCNSQWKHLI